MYASVEVCVVVVEGRWVRDKVRASVEVCSFVLEGGVGVTMSENVIVSLVVINPVVVTVSANVKVHESEMVREGVNEAVCGWVCDRERLFENVAEPVEVGSIESLRERLTEGATVDDWEAD